jgi:hypothetical protein
MAFPLANLTFGVEIECYVSRYLLAESGIDQNGYHTRVRQRIFGCEDWRCETDSSLSRRPTQDHTGAEFISPVLQGDPLSLYDVRTVLQGIKSRLGGRINTTCGQHVTVGWRDFAPSEDVKYLVTSFAQFQRAFYALTGSPRRETNGFCNSIQSSLRGIDSPVNTYDLLCGNDRPSNGYPAVPDRYQALNVSNAGRGFVEFRVFAGTLNPIKSALYAMLALGLVQKARSKRRKDQTWDQKPATSSCLKRKGEGAEQVERLLRFLGWTYTPTQKLTRYGKLVDNLTPYVLEARRLARRYDDRRNGA